MQNIRATVMWTVMNTQKFYTFFYFICTFLFKIFCILLFTVTSYVFFSFLFSKFPQLNHSLVGKWVKGTYKITLLALPLNFHHFFRYSLVLKSSFLWNQRCSRYGEKDLLEKVFNVFFCWVLNENQKGRWRKLKKETQFVRENYVYECFYHTFCSLLFSLFPFVNSKTLHGVFRFAKW